MNLMLNVLNDLDLLRYTSQGFIPERLKAGKSKVAEPEGSSCLKSRNEMYARRAFTPGGGVSKQSREP